MPRGRGLSEIEPAAGDGEIEPTEVPPLPTEPVEIIERLIALSAMQSWSAPLPTPADLVAYNEAQPDASE